MLTRFAPSPTGYLHIGNVRTALICWLYAKKQGGELLLRIDDTDTERSQEEYVEGIKEDLEWLGIGWDKIMRQSERFAAYDTAVEKLKEAGRLYACYETQEELEIKRKMLLGRGLPPIYDREGLDLSEEKRQEYEAEGRTPHWRFLLNDAAIEWEDVIRGATHFEGAKLSDPILVRENGAYTYMLPSTVDDIEFAVTDVVRGEDHVSNTAIQIQLFEALGGAVPRFAHNALIKTKEGKLSKRKGGAEVRELRAQGILPMAVNSFLAKVGTSDPIDIHHTLQELVDAFDMQKFGRAPTVYALEDITRLHVKLLHHLSFAEVKDQLDTEVDEAFWLSVRGNIATLEEVKTWWAICKEALEPLVEDKEYTHKAADLLPEGAWDADTWDAWIARVKEETGRKGKPLFMPLRKALTGMEHGPELKVILPLIGPEKAKARLSGEAA